MRTTDPLTARCSSNNAGEFTAEGNSRACNFSVVTSVFAAVAAVSAIFNTMQVPRSSSHRGWFLLPDENDPLPPVPFAPRMLRFEDHEEVRERDESDLLQRRQKRRRRTVTTTAMGDGCVSPSSSRETQTLGDWGSKTTDETTMTTSADYSGICDSLG